MKHTLLDHVARYEFPIRRRRIYYGCVALLLMGSVVSREYHLWRIRILRDTRESTQTMETTVANFEDSSQTWILERAHRSRVNIKQITGSNSSYCRIKGSLLFLSFFLHICTNFNIVCIVLLIKIYIFYEFLKIYVHVF